MLADVPGAGSLVKGGGRPGGGCTVVGDGNPAGVRAPGYGANGEIIVRVTVV